MITSQLQHDDFQLAHFSVGQFVRIAFVNASGLDCSRNDCAYSMR
jgi:hypothetical protein